MNAPPALRAVSRVDNLREQVSEALRAALISGQLRPGVVYSAPVLGEMLGVSATPVREAMLDLVREGLVEVLRNKGFRVTELSDHQLDQFAKVRLLLEVPTMGEVAAAADNPQIVEALKALRARADEMAEAARGEDMVRFIQLDTDFHTDFLALAGNAELVTIVRDLRNRSRLYGLEAVARAGLLDRSVAEHSQMIDLALAGDRPGLEALAAQHIGHVRTLWAEPPR
ncbi:DNA-binding GntR family transcriptional regulator [Kibdelosporangium banguiense]|uniref:DNA-binding GntR family transcriptional regulator n=1 Tax=Kibdelosporangium banguiense TaxID=1365924 RepID=A0ABS4TR86_9PSEU|nr:GntR family transcriptional regulator [Kibdelosporangium banguiense]MBP2326917.1 DNA-binding GntR family transcriptional regulator [Kibdelosporangium banguiense]